MTLSLRQLAELMPQRSGAPLEAQRPHIAIDLTPRPDEPYVWPDLIEANIGLPGPIHLLMAPGAMGKSAAARALAAELHAPYVDLAQIQVGAGTLTGELAKLLGFSATDAFLQSLREGSASLVLDSTDEAQLAAGRDNFIAFLNDLAWNLSDAVPSSQVVLLGRRDAIETTFLSLSELGFQAVIREVAPLSGEQAAELIDKSLDRKKKDDGAPYTTHRVHAEPFAQLRERTMFNIAKALDADVDEENYWSCVSDFLGYPPVLLALAERLRVRNIGAELARLRDDQHGDVRTAQGALLREVVERILDREAGKVQDRLGERLGIREADPQRSLLYSRDEQVLRLLNATESSDIEVKFPAFLSPRERAVYEDLVQEFLQDHPFLFEGHFANIVFSDYVRSWAVSSPLWGANHGQTRGRKKSLPKVGPFFAQFLYSNSGAAGNGDWTEVQEDLVDDLLHSINLSSSNARATYIQRGDHATLWLSRGNDADASASDDLYFKVVDLSGVLQLQTPLARLAIFTDGGVVLEGRKDHFDLGPDCAIIAEALDIKASSLSVTAGPSSSDSGSHFGALLSSSSTSHDGDLRITAFPENSLVISWPEAWYQWKPYAIAVASGGLQLPPQIQTQIVVGLRRILTSFRSSVRDDPSVYFEKLERLTVGSNDVFDATLTSLRSAQIVVREGSLYRLRLEKLSEYGVSWARLRGVDPGRVLLDLQHSLAKDAAFDKFRSEPSK